MLRLPFPVAVVCASFVSSAPCGLVLSCLCLFPPFVLCFVFSLRRRYPWLSRCLLPWAPCVCPPPPRPCVPIFPLFFLFVLFPSCFLAVYFFFLIGLSLSSGFVPLRLAHPPPAVLLFFVFFASPCFFGLLLVFFPGGSCCPALLLCRACSPCGAVCRVVHFCAMCFLVALRLLVAVVLPSPPPAVALVACGVFRPDRPVSFVYLRAAVSCRVVHSPVVWSPLWFMCCRAVPCWRACFVLFAAVVCCVVSLLGVLCCCLLRCFFFWLCAIPVCRAAPCRAALRCCLLCVVPCCAGLFLCPAVWCVAGLRPVVLWCFLVLLRVVVRCAAFLSALPCRLVVVWAVLVLWCLVLWCASVCCVAWSVLLRCFCCSLPCFLSWSSVIGCGSVLPSDPACGVLCCTSLCCICWRILCGAVVCCAGVPASCCPVVCSAVVRLLVRAGCCCMLLGVRWWAWLPSVVFWWCVSALVSLSGRVARRPVAWRLGVVPCGVLLPDTVSCGAVLP